MRSFGTTRQARGWHLATAVVVGVALVTQLGLVVTGESVLVTTGPIPNLPTRLVRFVSYFTIQSNLLVLITALTLVRDPAYDAPTWRVLRLNAVVGITVTGVIHWFLLRPILDLTGLSALTDTLLHLVVPVLAVTGWVVFGPRPRIARTLLLPSLVWPIAWLVYVLIFGAATMWYPYPFVDVGELGYARTAVNAVGIAALLLAVSAVFMYADRVLGGGRFDRHPAGQSSADRSGR